MKLTIMMKRNNLDLRINGTPELTKMTKVSTFYSKTNKQKKFLQNRYQAQKVLEAT